MRLAVCIAIVVCACKGSSPPAPPAATRFLPADPDTAFHLDVARVRAWSIYPKLAPVALTSVEMILGAAKTRCDLDVMGTAQTVIGAKKDALLSGDVTVVVTGLPRDKVSACLDTIAATKSVAALTHDEDRFHVAVAGKSIASGAILPTGEVVVVSRKGAGVEPAQWKTEVTQGARSVPAWWTELAPYLGEPIAVRASDGQRVVLATASFGDALTIRAKVQTKSAEAAKGDTKAANAILQYFQAAKAADGRVTTEGVTVSAELTAKGDQIDKLIAAGGAALFARGATIQEEATAEPRTCAELSGAVGTYMQTTLEATPPARKPELEQLVTKILPALQQAYVDQCTTGAWPNGAIDCHVKYASNLPRFEKCRMLLSEAQRTPFDKAVGDVLSAK